MDMDTDHVPKDLSNRKRKENDTCYGSDDLYPSGNVFVASPLDARVEKVLVKDGMDVKEGQPMFVFTVEVPKYFPLNYPYLSRINKFLKDISVNKDDTKCTITGLDNEDVLERYRNFKKFDVVVDHSDHHFSRQTSAMEQQSENWFNKMHDERRILERQLPDDVYVRVYESRMDLLRFAVVKQTGLTDLGGIFFFDVFIPCTYPDTAPLVHLYPACPYTININLSLGKVHSRHFEKCGGWKEMGLCGSCGTGNILNLLLHIRSLVYRTGYDVMDLEYENIMRGNSVNGEICVFEIKETCYISTLKTMAHTMNKPPKNFEILVVGHFRNHAQDILVECKNAMDGLQNQYLLPEANKEGIIKQIYYMTSCIKALMDAFNNIEAKIAEEFLPLSDEKRTLLTIAAHKPVFESHKHLCTFAAPTDLSVIKVLAKDKMAVHKGQPLFVKKMEATISNSSGAEDKVHLTIVHLAMFSEISSLVKRVIMKPEMKPRSELIYKNIWRKYELLIEGSPPQPSSSSSATQSDIAKDKVRLTKARLAMFSEISNLMEWKTTIATGSVSKLDYERIWRRYEKRTKACHTKSLEK